MKFDFFDFFVRSSVLNVSEKASFLMLKRLLQKRLNIDRMVYYIFNRPCGQYKKYTISLKKCERAGGELNGKEKMIENIREIKEKLSI
ncbi:MAG: hypothetical protein Q4B90_06925 [Eubacteriales bacterium]|nr:hypothetical protein [Eubacteriales bacterium]